MKFVEQELANEVEVLSNHNRVEFLLIRLFHLVEHKHYDAKGGIEAPEIKRNNLLMMSNYDIHV